MKREKLFFSSKHQKRNWIFSTSSMDVELENEFLMFARRHRGWSLRDGNKRETFWVFSTVKMPFLLGRALELTERNDLEWINWVVSMNSPEGLNQKTKFHDQKFYCNSIWHGVSGDVGRTFVPHIRRNLTFCQPNFHFFSTQPRRIQ